MRRYFLLTSFILLFVGVNVFAQREKTTDNFLAEFEWNFVGDYTYHYIKQENGKDLLDGPFSMKATINKKFDGYKTFYKATITGNYTLNGNHSKGAIHGALTMNAKLNSSATNGERQNNTYTFSGNFKNGLPNGNFQVNYPSYGIKVNVNYKEGILVGQYSVSGIDGLPFKKTGTLTADGKPTGVWKFDHSNGVAEETFLNGVVINRSDYDTDLKAKAKAYASGTISEEQLMKENIFVKTDSMSLGRDAWNQILHSGICFEKLGYYSFSKSEYVRYCYLDRLPFFSAEGYDKLKVCFVDREAYDNASFSIGGVDEDLIMEFYGGVVQFDKTAQMYFCKLHKSSVLSDYCVGYPDWSSYYEKIYMTNEQFGELRKMLHDYRMETIDKKPIESLYNPGVKDFMPCALDINVVAYKSAYMSYPGLIYYSIDTFEDYFINKDKCKELLEVTPENRQDVVKAKIQGHEEKIKAEYEAYKEKCKESVSKWFNDKVLNVAYENRRSISWQCELADKFFPMISYTADSVDVVNNRTIKVYSKVNVGEPDSYCVYSLIVYAEAYNDGRIVVDERSTLDSSNFKLLEDHLKKSEENSSDSKKSKKKKKMKGFVDMLEKALE